MLSRTAARRIISSHLEVPVVTFLARLGIASSTVTLLGLLVAGASAYLLSKGYLWAGGVVLFASGLFDLFDGALARATGRVTSFGALLDSVVDRLSEAVVLVGLLVFYLQRSSSEGVVLVYLALTLGDGQLPAGAGGGAGNRVQGRDNDPARACRDPGDRAGGGPLVVNGGPRSARSHRRAYPTHVAPAPAPSPKNLRQPAVDYPGPASGSTFLY